MTTQSYASGSSATDVSPLNAGTYGSWYETWAPAFRSSSISFSAGDSRTSSVSDLYAAPGTRVFEPLSDLRAPWFSACDTTERQKYGMLLFTSPASSMKRVEKSYSRAFHVK